MIVKRMRPATKVIMAPQRNHQRARGMSWMLAPFFVASSMEPWKGMFTQLKK